MIERLLQWWRGPKSEPTEQERIRERINRGELVTFDEAVIAIGLEGGERVELNDAQDNLNEMGAEAFDREHHGRFAPENPATQGSRGEAAGVESEREAPSCGLARQWRNLAAELQRQSLEGDDVREAQAATLNHCAAELEDSEWTYQE